ncbi:MAG: hypothetical protein R2941_08475, partial [Desulfobacterales bacterium]
GHKGHSKFISLHKIGGESALPSAEYDFNGELVLPVYSPTILSFRHSGKFWMPAFVCISCE